MSLTGLVPVLKCRSVDHSLQFYKDTLRFVEIRTRKGKSELEWVYLKSGNTYLMLELAGTEGLPSNHTISLYFYTDDIRSFHHYMLAKGYDISDLEKTAYGILQCVFTDPDGHKIQLGEVL